MKKAYKVISIAMIAIMLVCTLSTTLYALTPGEVTATSTSADDQIKTIGGKVLSAVTTAGIVLSVIMLAVFTFGINISEIINNFVEKTEENREEKYERRQQLREEQKKARMEAKQESIENRKKAKELQKEQARREAEPENVYNAMMEYATNEFGTCYIDREGIGHNGSTFYTWIYADPEYRQSIGYIVIDNGYQLVSIDHE